MSQTSAPSELTIAGHKIAPGTRQRFEIPVATLFDRTEVTIPVEVIRGKKPGPTLFISAAIHGDEINGVETIKRLLASRRVRHSTLRGTLIAVPIVNVYGFNRNSRYLPDRRDLNRCFPGSATGSLASQIAHIFMEEIVVKCTHGVDFHTAAVHRTNLPQIRACLDHDETERLASAFGVPVVMDSNIRDGSLRQAAAEVGIPMLLFEGGEALRYEEKSIRSAVQGTLSVMESIGSLKVSSRKKSKKKQVETYVARSSYWVRAPLSGSLQAQVLCGDTVDRGDVLGVISDPYGKDKTSVSTPKSGIVIGQATLPLVNQGDAMFHIATFEDRDAVEEQLEVFDETFEETFG